MAKEIALKLKITSQGEEKVISNLAELESELQLLQSTLKTLDFGSAAFKEATSNIAKLRTKIDEIDKASEGIGAEKKFRAIGDSINILTGSFQVLSGAIGLFTSDTQTLEQAQKAEKAALDVINLALGINAINTALVESATLRKAAADKIAELSTKALAAAQAAYNAVLNANPIVLFITAITALTGAIYLLVKATDEDTEAQEQSNAEKKEAIKLSLELSAVEKKAAQELKIQTTILTDNVSTRNLELQTLEDLKKTYPGFNAFIDENNRLTEEGIRFLRIQIRLQEIQATLQVLRTKKTDLEIKATQDLTGVIEDQTSIIGKTTTLITQFFKGNIGEVQAFGGAIKDAVKDEEAALNVVNNQIKEQTGEVDNLIGSLVPLKAALDKTAKAEAEAAKATKTTTEVIDLNLLKIRKRIAALDLTINKLNEAQKAELNYENTILDTQKEVLNEQEEFLKQRGEFFKTAGEKLIDEINNYLFKTIPSEEELSKLYDGYKSFFDITIDAIKSGDIDFKKATGWEEFVKFAETKLPGIGETLLNINEANQASFIEYFNSLDDRVGALRTQIEGLDFGLFAKPPNKEQLVILLNVEKEIANLRANRIKLGLTEKDVELASLKIIKEQFGIQAKGEELIKQNAENLFNYTQALEKGDTETAKRLKERIDAVDELLQKYTNIAGSILQGVIRTDEFVKGLVEVGKESDKNIAKILNLKTAVEGALNPEQLDGLKEYFKQNANDFLTIFTDILDNEEQYFNKLGEAGITALFSGIDEGLKDVESKTRTELENIQKFLKLFGDEFAKDFGLTENPFLKTLDAISKKLKQLPTESQESFTKTLDNIKQVADKVLQAFQQISSQLSSIVSSQNSLLLEQLDYQEAQALKAVEELNDDTEEGRKRRDAERLKVEKEYQKKRFDIEKKARIQELQFQLANALASSAQAIIGALATPPLGVGIALAGILAGLTGFQVGVINDQVQFVKNKQYVGRTGGLVEGSSHDTYGGGVPTLLEGGEFILNKEAVRAYGDQISSINTATGGKPMAIDDSRIVQAIAKQNLSTKTPLKAYVLYNDIQDTTKLNNKIEQLARL